MLQYKTIILNCNTISQYYCFYCIFDQIIAAFESRRAYFKKHKKILLTPMFWIVLYITILLGKEQNKKLTSLC